MPGSAHMFFRVAMEVAMPACGLFIMDDAMAASPIVVVAADGTGDMAGDMAGDADRAFAVARTILAVVEKVEEVLVVMLGMLAMSIFAVILFGFSNRIDGIGAEWRSFKQMVPR